MLMATRERRMRPHGAERSRCTMAIVTVVLLSGERLQRWLGDQAMQAIERLMGLILTAIAVEILLGGMRDFVQALR